MTEEMQYLSKKRQLCGALSGLGQEHFALYTHATSSGDPFIDTQVHVKIDKALVDMISLRPGLCARIPVRAIGLPPRILQSRNFGI